jgi:hypothetical protein
MYQKNVPHPSGCKVNNFLKKTLHPKGCGTFYATYDNKQLIDYQLFIVNMKNISKFCCCHRGILFEKI